MEHSRPTILEYKLQERERIEKKRGILLSALRKELGKGSPSKHLPEPVTYKDRKGKAVRREHARAPDKKDHTRTNKKERVW